MSADREDHTRKNGGEQCMGNTILAERNKLLHENGNCGGGRSCGMSGRQILKLKEARDPNVTEGDFKIGLGFATHTPTKATEQHFFSLQTNKVDPTNVWQVYSRKRGYKKQLDMGCADGVNSDTATALSITSPQQ